MGPFLPHCTQTMTETVRSTMLLTCSFSLLGGLHDQSFFGNSLSASGYQGWFCNLSPSLSNRFHDRHSCQSCSLSLFHTHHSQNVCLLRLCFHFLSFRCCLVFESVLLQMQQRLSVSNICSLFYVNANPFPSPSSLDLVFSPSASQLWYCLTTQILAQKIKQN